MNMFKAGLVGAFAGGLVSLPMMSNATSSDGEMDLLYEFQLEQLLDPSEEQLAMEKEGAVIIYDGLKDSDIKLALDSNQDRMENMMFVNVIWTDGNGEPLTDPYTGEVISDDDC